MSELARRLLAGGIVDRLVRATSARGVLEDLPAIDPVEAPPTVDWTRAVGVASALCELADDRAQDAALRLAQGALAGSLDDDVRAAATVVLERMGNARAIGLARRRQLIGVEDWGTSPTPIQLDVIRSRLALSVPLEDGSALAVNPFQREFWTAAAQHRWVSVSAATSAGKSFIVRTWLAERARSSDTFRAAYVVPTRALIEEVSADLQQQLGTLMTVHTLPWDVAIGTTARELYVMTQERLHLLLGRTTAGFDVLFIDEAQKFDDDERGVLLQRVLDEATRRRPDGQVLMASPLTENPELLLDGAPVDPLPLAMRSSTVTVNQNLLWVDQVFRKPRLWQARLLVDGDEHLLGTFQLAEGVKGASRLAAVAVALGNLEPGTVVYVNGPKEAEETAQRIHAALGDEASLETHPHISELRDLVRTTIHRSYALAAALERDVAFHYGSMPQIVRQEVERLFKAGVIRYLVCTSTLLEGVNLPCRLLLARGPKKGQGNPMTPGDFWNLAGRAGRWGKEFHGTIVCVDAQNEDLWPDPPRRRERSTIRRAADRELRDTDALLTYVNAGAPADDARQNPVLESVFSYLAARVLMRGTLDGIPGMPVDRAAEVQAAVADATSTLHLPTDVLLRHAGIGPLAMERLLAHFRATADWRAHLLPAADDRNAAGAYADALEICHRVLGAKYPVDGRRFAIGLLVVQWMRGLPLAVIIEARLRWLRNNRPDFVLATEIRNVMKDVEGEARFAVPKYLGCYLDVLHWHLLDIGEDAAADGLPDISMMLELGVSRTTELSLITLGLSRTSAITIGALMPGPDYGPAQCLSWLNARRLDADDLPAVVRAEVARALERHPPASQDVDSLK